MSKRIKGFTVALERDLCAGDIETLRVALYQLRGVVAVDDVEEAVDDWIVTERVRRELCDALLHLAHPKMFPKRPKGDR